MRFLASSTTFATPNRAARPYNTVVMGRTLRLFLPLLALALIGSKPVQDAKISYTTKAKRADLVLEDIAKQTGRTIETSPDAKLHYLVVSVKDVDPNTLLDQIAKVMSCKWNVAGDRWILLVDEQERRSEQDKKNKNRVERFKQAQDLIRKELAKKPNPDPESEEYDWPMFTSPGEKALAQLSLLINPNEIATLEDKGRVVFSTLPNRMQRAMTSNQVSNILATLVKDHNAYAQEQIASNEEMKRMMQEAGEDYDMGWFEEKYYLFETPAAKALIVLQMEGAEYGYTGEDASAKLIVYDQKGKAIVNSTISFTPEYYDHSRFGEFDPETGEMIQKEEEKEDQKPISEEDRTPIELSEQSKKFQSLTMSDELTFKIPEDVLALLRDPVELDPLSFHITDALHSIAKVKKLNIVANLADSESDGGFAYFMDSETSVTVGSALSGFTEGEEPRGTIKDGWLTIKPTDPISSRKDRQDRVVLKQLIDRSIAEGRASLDTLAQFALSSPPPMVNGVSMLYIFAFSPNMMQTLIGDSMDWNMLRFYGSLMPPQKSALMDGGRVQFSNLTAKSREILTEMAFGAAANIKTAEQMAEESKMPFFLTMWMDMAGSGVKTAIEEPTELMPNGLPPAGWVDLNLTKETVANQDGGNTISFFGFGSMGASEIALMEVIQENSESGEDYFKLPDRIKLGSRDKLKFNFWLSTSAGMTKTVYDDKPDKNAQAISFINLPTEFRAEIEKRKKEIKESPYGRMLGGIGLRL